MTKAVIFDLDGLLIDTEVISYEIYKEILQEFGHDFTKTQYAQNYSGKTEIKNVTNLIETYELPWTLEQGLDKVADIEHRLLSQGVDLKPGAKVLLGYLRDNHFKIAIASSGTEQRGKPNPDIFLKACEKIGEQPEDCLVLEDSEAGVQAAHSANIPVICIPDMKTLGQQYLDMTKAVLHSLDEVIEYL